MELTEEEMIELAEKIVRRERTKLFWGGMIKTFLIAGLAVLTYKGLQTISDDSKK